MGVMCFVDATLLTIDNKQIYCGSKKLLQLWSGLVCIAGIKL